MSWLRWYDDVIHDKKISRIARETGLPYLQVLGAWGAILVLAHESPVRGRLLVTGNEPMTEDDISETFRCNVTVTLQVLQAFVSKDMLTDDGEPGLAVTNWDKRQFASDSSVDRVRKHREMKRYSAVTVTVPEQNRADQSTDQSTDQSIAYSEEGEGAPHPLLTLLQSIPGYPSNGSDSTWLSELESDFAALNLRRVLTNIRDWDPAARKPQWKAYRIAIRRWCTRDAEEVKAKDDPRSEVPF